MIDTYEPNISRLLSVPPETTFDKLHEAIQIAFGWTNSHLHSFEVAEKATNGALLGDTLLRLQTSADYMGLEPDPEEEAKYSLADVYEKEEWKDKKLTMVYEYDMGDGWVHEIMLLGRADQHLGDALSINETSGQRIVVISGEGHGCAEDCGGLGGWEALKDAFAKTKGGDKELKDWYKRDCPNGDKKGLNPYQWDILDINDKLGEVILFRSFDES